MSEKTDPFRVVIDDERTGKSHELTVDAHSAEQAIVYAKDRIVRGEGRGPVMSSYHGLVCRSAMNLAGEQELLARLAKVSPRPVPFQVIEISRAIEARKAKDSTT